MHVLYTHFVLVVLIFNKKNYIEISDWNVIDITLHKKNIHKFIWQYRLLLWSISKAFS